MKRNKRSFNEIMDRLSARHGVHRVFSDFLTLLVCAFSHGKMEGLYLETINRYEKPEAYDFSEALAALVIEMAGDGTGMVDVLGAYFEENISHGKNGQFFTPQQICDLLARVNTPDRYGSRILDPACGSGRMLMAMGKLNRYALFYGADVDVN
ncbi:MAG TPA: N-6 DNA methylase, partial [Bacteroidales bacterium]|nr:N-6 DNA methylase [Bacteroidales bacterium]